jgi:histidinol phosphatase-like enzyme (inositol monophosphatase family)
MEPAVPDNLLQTLEKLARDAGAITLKYFQNPDLEVEAKQDESPVTIADRETEQFVRSEVARLFPGDVVIGEEFGEGPGAAGARRWIVDPIDGTKSFIHGVPLYGVMIGVEESGEMVAGAVFIPPLNDMVVAVRGEGCWWNGRRASVSTVDKLEQSLILTTDVANQYKQGKGASWEALCKRARLVRTWGDCYGHILVATGRAEAMFDPQMNPWDCAALMTILKEAGGTFTDYNGRETVYGADAFSSNGVLLSQIREVLDANPPASGS